MTTYQITNRASGLDLGTFTAESEQEAREELARDAGYESAAEMAEVTGDDGADLDLRGGRHGGPRMWDYDEEPLAPPR